MQVEIVEADPDVEYKYKTQVVYGNGFNPKYKYVSPNSRRSLQNLAPVPWHQAMKTLI
jgi:hypothetical protein